MPATCAILPPFLLDRLAQSDDATVRAAAARNLTASAAVRAERNQTRELRLTVAGAMALAAVKPPDAEQIVVYDGKGGVALPGTRVRALGEPASADAAVNQALDGADATYDFYDEVFQRKSVDDDNLELISTVHYGKGIDNAFWNGQQMLYGDGSGKVFRVGSLTTAIDVIAHEITHGVTDFTARLAYHDQPGALNESWSDVFGSLVKQRVAGQAADAADWLIGEDLLVPAIGGVALRSMKAPGTAFPGDPQPATMSHYVTLPNDNLPRNDAGGVHINSGIPNRAFYLVATKLGGNAWERPGRIWYETLRTKLIAEASFLDAANGTADVAATMFGENGDEHRAVVEAWTEVGVLTPKAQPKHKVLQP